MLPKNTAQAEKSAVDTRAPAPVPLPLTAGLAFRGSNTGVSFPPLASEFIPLVALIVEYVTEFVATDEDEGVVEAALLLPLLRGGELF